MGKEVKSANIAMIGVAGVGKSALTLRYMYSDFVEEYDPTKADAYKKKLTINNVEYSIELLDTAGQEEYMTIRDTYYKHGDGFLFVFSLTDRNSFEKLQEFYDGYGHTFSLTPKTDYPIVLVGNKEDLRNQRAVTKEEAEERAQQWGCSYFETSAKNKINVSEVYEHIILKATEKKLKKDQGKKGKRKAKKCTIL